MSVAPDIARVTAGVRTQDWDPKQAAQANAALADAVAKAVRGVGVADKDIRTEGYSLNPQYRYQEGKDPVITGYEVVNNIRVTVRKIADAGRVLDAAVKAGANVAGGIEFDLADETQTRTKDGALAGAVADAARKAVVIARAAKAGRIDLVSIVEGEPVINYPRPMMMATARIAGAAIPTPVAPGEQTVTATVTLRYAINPAGTANY